MDTRGAWFIAAGGGVDQLALRLRAPPLAFGATMALAKWRFGGISGRDFSKTIKFRATRVWRCALIPMRKV